MSPWMPRRRATCPAMSHISVRPWTTELSGCCAKVRKYRSAAVRSFTVTSEALSRSSVGIIAMRTCRRSIGDAKGASPSVKGILCALSSRSAYADKAPMARHELKRFSLRKRAVSRRGVASAANSERPSSVSPRWFPLRCKASRLGKVEMARRITSQSWMPFPSNTSDFSLGNGHRCSAPAPCSSSGIPSVKLLCAKWRCSRLGKRPAASMASNASHVTMVLVITSVRTRQTNGCSTKRWSQRSVGAFLGIGSCPPGGGGAKRVLAKDSHSSCGQSSQMATTSAQSFSIVLSSQRLFRFGRLQSPAHTSSG
mmetsp:Transcript_30520/g.97551  ORF Transcript_30520/g.97551 Transcript_30520/m.97551 type:complete len:311 (+) Transcript_30520:411-1343(+)